MKLFSVDAVRYHFRPSGLSAICIASNPNCWVLLCRCLHYLGFTLKTFINSDTFYGFATENGDPSAVATRQFPVSLRSNVLPVLWRFQFFVVSQSNFLHSERLILVASSFRTILILLLSLHVYNSFTLDCFTLLVVLPKNKIRSIINSFKLLNTELPRLLIFLYCSPGTFSHSFETLLFLLVWQETNISNELLL